MLHFCQTIIINSLGFQHFIPGSKSNPPLAMCSAFLSVSQKEFRISRHWCLKAVLAGEKQQKWRNQLGLWGQGYEATVTCRPYHFFLGAQGQTVGAWVSWLPVKFLPCLHLNPSLQYHCEHTCLFCACMCVFACRDDLRIPVFMLLSLQWCRAANFVSCFISKPLPNLLSASLSVIFSPHKWLWI